MRKIYTEQEIKKHNRDVFIDFLLPSIVYLSVAGFVALTHIYDHYIGFPKVEKTASHKELSTLEILAGAIKGR